MTPITRQPSRSSAAARRRESAVAGLGDAPFTVTEALAAGLTHADLRSTAVTPVTRGVFIAPGRELDHGLRCAAVLKRLPRGARIAGLDAARLWGLPAPERSTIQAVLPPEADRRIDGVSFVRGASATSTPLWVQSARSHALVTHPDDLLQESVAHLDFIDAVTLADAILRRRGERHA